ncbi:MAG TPA: hypothetical protein VIG80_00645 [Bacillaceae bacterium]
MGKQCIDIDLLLDATEDTAGNETAFMLIPIEIDDFLEKLDGGKPINHLYQ